MQNKMLFKNFTEYWYYARNLSDSQRKIILDCLPQEQQYYLVHSYKMGGWDCVFARNKIDEILDDVKKRYKYDILEIKSKVIRGKSVYLPLEFWQEICQRIGDYGIEHTEYVLGGIKAVQCKANEEVVLLVRDSMLSEVE
tara:strand:- start:4335 stop:4754 length:420 start_codon:yes stop_codon:yes gene_type:complete